MTLTNLHSVKPKKLNQTRQIEQVMARVLIFRSTALNNETFVKPTIDNNGRKVV